MDYDGHTKLLSSEESAHVLLDRIAEILDVRKDRPEFMLTFIKSIVLSYKDIFDRNVELEKAASEKGYAIIERDTAKKPIEEQFSKYSMFRCPSCERTRFKRDAFNFCPNCGQRIDWTA